jgi:hypothetical protein
MYTEIYMEFIITIFHYHKGHDIDHAIFGKKATENKINEDIRIFPSGGLTRMKGLQEKYLKLNLRNNNDFNLELLSDFLFHRLSSIDDADSLKIGNNITKLKKDEIKKALQTYITKIWN